MDTVVELYTSQGCSSCPPADALMGDIVNTANKTNVLGLSFAVTYWDYIGWKDTFGSPQNDLRQTQYKERLRTSYVYTPQMIVGGKDHFVGSSSDQLSHNLAVYKGHARQLPLKWKLQDDVLEIALPSWQTPSIIWQTDLNHAEKVSIGRGENTGRKITYHNVVRKLDSLANWDGKPKTLKLSLKSLREKGRDSCAILVQENGYGSIVAALFIQL
ncbi:DUF1223 domain-containing protein [Sneathiella limimaris]|uniref:DUF1223 domain-containing protein n=1 Tax=Sneathiella limimaris TaxID=1964213 RepID=UPI0019D08B2F|nr:DUF1223 domain-containing protein [Sneathiella limimaris]